MQLHIMFVSSFNLQALRGWRGQDTDKGKLSDDKKAVWRTRLCAWVSKRQADEKKFPKLQTLRLANKAHMQARDHALLAGVGLPLASSRLPGHSGRWLPTRCCSSRTLQSCPLLSEQQALAGKSKHVSDKLSNQTRLLAHWSEPRRVLHCSMDQGTIGWPANYFLYFSQDLRGWMIMDPSHRRHNNVHDAMRDSSLAHLKHEMTI